MAAALEVKPVTYLQRRVSSETLDHLDENDPRAIRSRRDLQRIHTIMRTPGILLNALHKAAALAGIRSDAPLRILELGAGDGTLMLRCAHQLAAQWPRVQLTLLDRQLVISSETLAEYRRLGWQPEVQFADVTDWAEGADSGHWDLIVANLFMHHFDEKPLQRLLNAIAKRTQGFIACEPRRSKFAVAASHLIGLIGANEVTREDAVLSVQAGFDGLELTRLWPQPEAWQLMEYGAGLFSHCFIAAHPSRDKTLHGPSL